MRVLLTLLLVSALAGVGLAQDSEWHEVAIRVTRVTGRTLQLNRGKDHQLVEGDHVVLQPPGTTERDAVVRIVNRKTAQAEVIGSVAGITSGTLGAVLVPIDRWKASQKDEPSTPQPPWEQDLAGWDSSLPLLADALTTTSAERPIELHGRAWFSLDYSQDRERGRFDNGSASLGTSAQWDNPFGYGGQGNVEARGLTRWSDASGGLNSDDSTVRIDRASYAFGGTRDEPMQWEVGRFLQNEFPELGIVDGFEVTQRLPGGARVGGSFGFLPRYDLDRTTGQDLQAAVYYADHFGDLELGSAFQKTWHDGTPDRDLVLTTFGYRPTRRHSLRGGIWVDLYDQDDEFKSEGPELTEARVTASYYEADQGASLNLSRYRFPDVDRFQFAAPTAEELVDGMIDRVGLYGWKRLQDDLRVSARADSWKDEDNSGQLLEVRAAVRDRLLKNGEVGLALFSNDGQSTDASGIRLDAWRPGNVGVWRFAMDLTRFDLLGVSGSDGSLNQVTLRGGWDGSIGSDWLLSVSLEQRLGDDQDSTYLGLTLTRTF